MYPKDKEQIQNTLKESDSSRQSDIPPESVLSDKKETEMFNNTIATIKNTVRDIKRFACAVTVVTQLVTVGYFTYLCFTGAGTLPINITLAAVSLGYLAVYLATYGKKDKAVKEVRSKALKVGRILKLLGKTVTLGITVYGIYISSTTTDSITVILATLSIISWIIQVIFEIVRAYVEAKAEELVESFKKDVNVFRVPKEEVARTVRDIAPEVAELAREGIEAVKHGVKAFNKGKSIVSKIGSKLFFGRKGRSMPTLPEPEGAVIPEAEVGALPEKDERELVEK